MYCKYCGKQIADKAVYCVHCGVATDAASSFNSQPVVQTSKTNGYAITGFILAIVSLVGGWFTFEILPVLGLIFSIIGLVKSKSSGKGKGLSIAGIVISAVAIVLIIIFTVYFLADFFNGFPSVDPPDIDYRY